MPVGAAIAAAGIGGAALQASASRSAAGTQATAANRAADMQLGMFNTIRGDLDPYRTFGGTALPGIMKLLGLGGSESGIVAGGANWDAYAKANQDVADAYGQLAPADKARFPTLGDYAKFHYETYGKNENRGLPTFSASEVPEPGADISAYLENLPGYKFTRDQGILGITNAMSARGHGGIDGAYGKGLARFVTGLANQTYGEQLQRLLNVASVGQNAAVQTGNFGQTATTGASSALMGGANATAAGQVGSANAAAAGLGSAANGYLTSRVLGMYGGSPGGGGFSTPPSMEGLY